MSKNDRSLANGYMYNVSNNLLIKTSEQFSQIFI